MSCKDGYFSGPYQGMSHFDDLYHGIGFFKEPSLEMSVLCGLRHAMIHFHERHTDFEYDWLRDDLIQLCQKAKEEGQSMPWEARSLLRINLSAFAGWEARDWTRGLGSWSPGPRSRKIVNGRPVSYVREKEFAGGIEISSTLLHHLRCE